MGLIYISHRMAEIFRLADRLSIIKDGRMIGPLDPNATSIQTRFGVDVEEQGRQPSSPAMRPPLAAPAVVRREPGDEIALAVEDLRTERKLSGLSFSLRRGEILGVAGLVGSGRSTLAKALFGLLPDAFGRVSVAGKPLPLGDADARMQAGLALVPEDRRLEGLVLNGSLANNIALPTLRRLTRNFGLPVVSDRRVNRLFDDFSAKLGIAARGPQQLGSELSGGNQQKTVFAKWLASNPKVLDSR